ncbi:DUF2793 domain-containing protein [Profundibacter sp.]|uniref:DUF2793 domain-containing protein n=1 Tax=Profundibacter sp. TaxID=3101071 RepID=UPI003D0F4C28
MTNTPNLALPYLAAAQAQKHVTVNEALSQLDGLVQLSVLDRDLASPPGSPTEGDRYLVAAGATGAWAGWDGDLVLFSGGAWLRLIPQTGWMAWDVTASELLVWNGSAWASFVPNLQNLSGVGIGTSSDATNRLAVSAAATLLNHAGNGHHLKINKAAADDTASLLFQTNWSGRAEMGTAGSDDFVLKVSADGSTFFEALRADGNTGAASFPNGMDPERRSIGGLTKGGGTDWWGPVDPFTLSYSTGSQQTLSKGWYVTTMGVSGAGAYARYGRWMTLGLTRYYPHSSGTSAYPRVVAPQVYLYENSSNAEITGGLPASWTGNPVSTMTSTNNWVYQMVFPKWREV